MGIQRVHYVERIMIISFLAFILFPYSVVGQRWTKHSSVKKNLSCKMFMQNLGPSAPICQQNVIEPAVPKWFLPCCFASFVYPNCFSIFFQQCPQDSSGNMFLKKVEMESTKYYIAIHCSLPQGPLRIELSTPEPSKGLPKPNHYRKTTPGTVHSTRALPNQAC